MRGLSKRGLNLTGKMIRFILRLLKLKIGEIEYGTQ